MTEYVGASDCKHVGASDREHVGASDGATVPATGWFQPREFHPTKLFKKSEHMELELCFPTQCPFTLLEQSKKINTASLSSGSC